MQRVVIGLHGLPLSGKDTLAKLLIEKYGADKAQRIALADPMREALYKLNPLVFVPANLEEALGSPKFKRFGEAWEGAKDKEAEFERAIKETYSKVEPGVVEAGEPSGVCIRLKELVYMVGWDIAKLLPDVRNLLRRFGTEVGRELFGERCWIDIAEAKMLKQPQVKLWIVTDVRFRNEAVWVRGGFTFSGVLEIISERSEEPSEHQSDQGIPRSSITKTLENNGTKAELLEQALTAINAHIVDLAMLLEQK